MNKRYILYLLTVLLTTACTDDISEGGNNPETGEGLGEKVLFSSGTTENRVTRADEKTTYMPAGYHFVCRMYYKAQTGSNDFDVSGNTDLTAWLKVDGNVGNSLYWNKDYTNPSKTDDYGNDFYATAFYWQNRKDHAFLAWTDLNKAPTITGGNASEALKFAEDKKYKVYTGEESQSWVTTGYNIYGIDKNLASLSEMKSYVEKNITNVDEFNTQQEEIGIQYDWTDAQYYYQYGLSCKYTDLNVSVEEKDPTHKNFHWYQYKMFFDKVSYTGSFDGLTPVFNEDKTTVLYKDVTGKYVAAGEVKKDSEGNCLDGGGNKTTDPDSYAYNYYETDEGGQIRYDETKPRYTFYYQQNQEYKTIKNYDEYSVLAFDLTREGKNSMNDQPDIVQAKEIQAPSGATQESNRVNLYFKHKFSQIQVNVKNAADESTVSLEPQNILGVELLGVSKEGYIFTELNKDGVVHDAAYEEIDFSQFSADDLEKNPYGTSFSMFPMSDTATGYLKSFNCITFGQLQAIRITWKEHDTAIEHASIFRIPNTELVNLKSGVKYIWNIELRRGTLAIIRTEIVDWELPDDINHNGGTDATIND